MTQQVKKILLTWLESPTSCGIQPQRSSERCREIVEFQEADDES